MQSTTLDFPYNSRTTFTAIKNLFRKQTGFSSVDYNEDLFVVEAKHGFFLSPFSEIIKIKVVATSYNTSKVVVESTSRSVLNLLNFGANKENISNLSDYINNEVFKLMQPGEIPMHQQQEHSEIKIFPSEIVINNKH